MVDDQLKQLFCQVAVEHPAPESLFNASRIRSAVRARRRNKWAVVAVLFLITATGLSSAGKSLVQAAVRLLRDVNMAVRVVTMTDEEEARVKGRAPDPARSWSYSSIGLHETKDMSTIDEHGVLHKAGLRSVTVQELLKEGKAWPLPEYLPPHGETKVVIRESFYPDSETRVVSSLASIEYKVAYKGQIHHVSYRTFLSEKPYPVPKDPRVWVSSSHSVVQETVDINGHQAVAVRSDQSDVWQLRAYYNTGYLHLSADLPLDVLVEMAESIPVLQHTRGDG